MSFLSFGGISRKKLKQTNNKQRIKKKFLGSLKKKILWVKCWKWRIGFANRRIAKYEIQIHKVIWNVKTTDIFKAKSEMRWFKKSIQLLFKKKCRIFILLSDRVWFILFFLLFKKGFIIITKHFLLTDTSSSSLAGATKA